MMARQAQFGFLSIIISLGFPIAAELPVILQQFISQTVGKTTFYDKNKFWWWHFCGENKNDIIFVGAEPGVPSITGPHHYR